MPRADIAIAPANDSQERQADRVSGQVAGVDPWGAAGAIHPRGPAARDTVHLDPVRASGLAKDSAPDIVDEVLNSPGQSLDGSTRAFMEPRFGHDFSRVRVHAGSLATRAASAVGARAFVVGRHIVFNAGEHGASTGRLLRAHELAHVVQQAAGTHHHGPGAPVLQRKLSATPLAEHPVPEHTPKAGEGDLDQQAIRKKLEGKGLYLKLQIDEMMEIATQLDASGAVSAELSVDQIVTQIELRWVLVQTMKIVEGDASRQFRFPDAEHGYRVSPSEWAPLSEAYTPPGGRQEPKGEGGYEQPMFRPKYEALVPPTAASAIDAIFKNNPGHPIVLDCNAMMVAVQYKAMKDLFGSGRFNEMFPEKKQGLYIGPVGDQKSYPPYDSKETTGDRDHPFREMGLYTETLYPDAHFDEASVKKELVAGDWVYFQNHRVYAKYQPAGMWQGEHALYVGDGNFIGAGLDSACTYDGLLEKLQTQYELARKQYEQEYRKAQPKLTKAQLPGIVVRLVPNVPALEKLPKAKRQKK